MEIKISSVYNIGDRICFTQYKVIQIKLEMDANYRYSFKYLLEDWDGSRNWVYENELPIPDDEL